MSSAAKAPADTGTAVAERPATPALQAEPVTILNIIERAAFDKTVDADKVAKLLEMGRQHEADLAKRAYTKAMLKVKLELPIIDRRGLIEIHEKGKPKTKENLTQSTAFARWEDIDAAITPILNKHGFALMFRTGNGPAPDYRVIVTGVLMHEDGHSEESSMALPLDTSGSKNNVQAAGSSTSYGKRYVTTALLNIRTKGEDDDGTEGGNPGKITQDQRDTIQGLIDKFDADVEKFCEYLGVASLADIPHDRYGDAIAALNLKATQQGGGKSQQQKAKA
jgi:hypothetical protein